MCTNFCWVEITTTMLLKVERIAGLWIGSPFDELNNTATIEEPSQGV